jgi:phosphate starvation-inducible PhoH-like protein
MEEEKHYFDNWDSMNSAFAGNLARNLKESENRLSVKLVARDSWIKVIAEKKKDLDRASDFLNELIRIHNQTGLNLDQRDFEQILSAFQRNCEKELDLLFSKRVRVSPKKRDIVPRNKTQLDYLESIREKDIVFGVGPAGTGKTYLAMAMAVSELLEGKFNRIILTRPAIEAGEKLGFLPGNLEEKILPYLRPLYDALYDMLEFEEASALIEKNIIEVAPLAFMRGRTLNNAFIILDEAQNTTIEQMLMFLTRLGFDSHSVITGDPSQTDLPSGQESGLLHSINVLKKIQEIGITKFTTKDVVRHSLVEKIINAYQRDKTPRSRK